MLSDTQKTFMFALIMCGVCSIALSVAAVGLKERQDRNIEIDRQKNVLKALGLLEKRKYQTEEIESLYETMVNNRYIDESGNIVVTETERPVFIVGSSDNISTYAVPFKAYGLWSWISGYVALKGDGETIIGLTVYAHGETPGLGGEVEKAWFQDQFIGKKITNKKGQFISIGIEKGKASEKYSGEALKNVVDGISGATITSKGMEKYLKEALQRYEAFALTLRKRT